MNMNETFYSINVYFGTEDFNKVKRNENFDLISDIAEHVTIYRDGSIYFRNGESNENGKGAHLMFRDGKMVFGGNDFKNGIMFSYELEEMNKNEYIEFINDKVRDWFVSGFH